MFKKLFLALLACFLIASPVLASPDNRTIIDAVQLDDDPTSTTGTWGIQDYKSVCFFTEVDETEVGNSISVAVTMHFSYDGTNWVTGNWYDIAGGSTLQSSETISSDGWYFYWLNPDWKIPYVRVTITATNTDTDDLAVVTTYLVGNK